MKKVLLVLAWTAIVATFLAMAGNIAFADTSSDDTAKVPKDTVIKVPGAGPDVVVEVPYVVQRIHEVAAAPMSYFHLRGGPSVSVMMPGRAKPSFVGGLVGEIGYADWSLQGTFRAGNCNTGGEKGLAVDSGLAVMNNVTKKFRVGVGADLLYCSNVYDRPKEKAAERIVGGSLRLEYQEGHLLLGAQVGGGAATVQIPGGRDTQGVLYGGIYGGILIGK